MPCVGLTHRTLTDVYIFAWMYITLYSPIKRHFPYQAHPVLSLLRVARYSRIVNWVPSGRTLFLQVQYQAHPVLSFLRVARSSRIVPSGRTAWMPSTEPCREP